VRSELIQGRTGVTLAALMLAWGCDDITVVDNWPTYEVRGTVRTAVGAPVSAVLVEMETYNEPACGTAPLFALGWSTTDLQGRYRVEQEEMGGLLNGCLRLVAHPDTSALSQPTATVDLPVDSVPVRDGETIFTVDLTVP
jgi:hypothetical protein